MIRQNNMKLNTFFEILDGKGPDVSVIVLPILIDEKI